MNTQKALKSVDAGPFKDKGKMHDWLDEKNVSHVGVGHEMKKDGLYANIYPPKGTSFEEFEKNLNKSAAKVADVPVADEFSSLTKAELLTKADGLGLKLDARLNKDQIIEAIKDA